MTSVGLVLILGIVTSINILAIYSKLNYGRTYDALLDAAILILLAYVFSGTISGLAIGTISSAFISLFLFWKPPNEVYENMMKNQKKSNRKRKNKFRRI